MRGQAAEQVWQCPPSCLAGLLELLARASQAAFSVDKLVEAQDGLESVIHLAGLAVDQRAELGVRQEWPV